MKIILAPNCKSITGSLGQGFGYHIEHRKNGFFAIRNAKGAIPPDGHWRFIIACAEIAKMKLHFKDIEISWNELMVALGGVHHFAAARMVHDNYYSGKKTTYNAADVINLKTTFGI